MSNTENRLPRVALGRSGRTVPQANMAAVLAYEASPEWAAERVNQWLRDAEELAAEEARLGAAW